MLDLAAHNFPAAEALAAALPVAALDATNNRGQVCCVRAAPRGLADAHGCGAPPFPPPPLFLPFMQTALHYAAAMNSIVAAAVLLKRGADVSIRDRQGRTPFYVAAELGTAAVLDVLTDPANYPDPAAARDIIKLRLETPAHSGGLPIHCAVQNSFTNIVILLLWRGPPNYALYPEQSSGQTPLHIAVQAGDAPLAIRTFATPSAILLLHATHLWAPAHAPPSRVSAVPLAARQAQCGPLRGLVWQHAAASRSRLQSDRARRVPP